MNNILRYEGYASLAMVGLVSGGVLNMAGDAFFMFGLHMGVRGAALSTMISQYISFGILLYFLLCGKTQSSLSIRYLRRKQVSLEVFLRPVFQVWCARDLQVFLRWY